MKRLTIVLVTLCAMSSMALAAPVIGVFENTDATVCWGDIEPYVMKSIYVSAILIDIPAITAAEFSVANWFGDEGPECVLVTYLWNTDLVIGDLGYGIALAFSPALPGPVAIMGQIDLFLLDASCVGTDWHMQVSPAGGSGNLVVVDENFNEIPAIGYFYTFNCTEECWCEHCTPTAVSNWGAIKALF